MPDLETELMGCCGLNGICNLNPEPKHYNDCDEEDCDGCFESDGYSTIAECVSYHEHKGIIIAVTNAEQEENGIGKELQAHGFHAVLNTLNKNSMNRITLWVRDHTEEKVPEKLTAIPTPAPGNVITELIAAVRAYVERNPNPHTQAARRLVAAYKEFGP